MARPVDPDEDETDQKPENSGEKQEELMGERLGRGLRPAQLRNLDFNDQQRDRDRKDGIAEEDDPLELERPPVRMLPVRHRISSPLFYPEHLVSPGWKVDFPPFQ